MFNYSHNERYSILRKYIAEQELDVKLIVEREYPSYSIFRMSNGDASDVIQFQVFKDGTIMKNCKQVLDWKGTEKLTRVA